MDWLRVRPYISLSIHDATKVKSAPRAFGLQLQLLAVTLWDLLVDASIAYAAIMRASCCD